MTVDEVLAALEPLGHESVRGLRLREGATEQFGVRNGDVRKVARTVGRDAALAQELWATGNTEARMVAILATRPKDVTAEQLEAWVRSQSCLQEADWCTAYLLRAHADREGLRVAWLDDPDPWAARAAWDLTAVRVEKDPEGLDLDALLDVLAATMGDADERPQWTMNTALTMIGVHHPDQRDRAIAIGERLGVLRDYPTPRNCTSPFAPIAITELVARASA